jgi:membrane protease YdiL (CAAX protease family)
VDDLQPTLIALAAFVAYVAVVGIVWRATGTHYDHLVDTRSTVLRGIVLPIGLGGLLLAAVTTWQGWWSAVLSPAATGPAWVWVVPALWLLVALLNISSIDWRATGARLLPLIVIGVVLVGFAEELAARGILVVGLRDSGATELVVWLVSSGLFALLHGLNAFFGQSARTTLIQMVMSFFAGTALFVTVMVSGSLLLAMALHALWDLGTLGIAATGGTQKRLAGLVGLVMFATAAVAVGFVVVS